MGQHEMFFPLMLFGVLLASTAAIAAAQAKPGCLDHCGNVRIPYPFGIGGNCYLYPHFNITCNHSTNPPKPFAGDVEVSNISLGGQMRIMNFIAHDCYDNNNRSVYNLEASLFATGKTSTVSNAQNKFVAIGCDTFAIVQGFRGNDRFTTGCMSFCDRLDQVDNGSCSGIGCCEIPIPDGITEITMTLSSYYNHSRVWDFNPCSHGFIIEKDEFTFSTKYFYLNKKDKLPMVFDWAVGDDTESCETAEKNKTSFLCKENSTCDKSYNGPGYRCKCFPGYEGNPYLDGCKDVDECRDPSLNDCEKGCVNNLGNYTCSCPKGDNGDGRKSGKGCIPNRLQVLPVALGIGIGIGLLFLLLGILWLNKLIQRRKCIKLKEKFFKRNGGLLLQQKVSSNQGTVETTKLFTSTELEIATDQYNENRILGRGGQGTVYKGMLTNGRIVAVKKSRIVNEGQLEQFINEVVILSQIGHRNIVKLLGCCLETEVPLLVYEFIPNGTLSHLIHDQSEEFPMSWEMRLRIATDIASAISYLHSAASVPIYHRDIKSTNVLLDEKFRAKVSDFGTSRSVAIDQTHLTTQVKGTFGYFDPEYFHSHQFTEKSDVYSFGVVFVELLTGKRAISSIGSEEKRSLATEFISSIEEDRFLDVLAPRVAREGGKAELMEVASLARKCLSLNGRNRPSMKEVVMELEGIRMSQGYLPTQHKQVGLLVAEPTEHWEFSSTSTGSHLDSITTCTSNVPPLMINTI